MCYTGHSFVVKELYKATQGRVTHLLCRHNKPAQSLTEEQLMQAFIIDDGTMDTVVQIIAKGATFIQRFDSDYRYSFDSDPDISTEYFLEEVRDEFDG